MSESTHSTGNYWGSNITIQATQQGDGTWSAVATVQPAGATAAAKTLRAVAQPTAAAAMAAAQSLATAEVDTQRMGQGKP